MTWLRNSAERFGSRRAMLTSFSVWASTCYEHKTIKLLIPAVVRLLLFYLIPLHLQNWSGLLFSSLLLIAHQSSNFCRSQAYRSTFALAAAWIGAAGRAQWIGCKQLCMHGSELKELSSGLSRAETHQIGLARPSSKFLIGLGYKAKMVLLYHWSTNLTCCRNFSLSLFPPLLTLTLMNSSAFLRPQIIFHGHNIQWLIPTTLRPFCDYCSQAWEGPLIPLMSHKRRRIIHSNSLDIGWYFNIRSLTLRVYLPTELALAQMPSDTHLQE